MFDLGVTRPETELNNDASRCGDPGTLGRRAADMAVQFLNGAKPSESPIFLPTKFEMLTSRRRRRAASPCRLNYSRLSTR
jgi:hypothetical protein